MGQLHIPDIGERLCLSEPWTFKVHLEHRNGTLLQYLGVERSSYWWAGPNEDPGPWSCTLAAGTVLTVDRIYIRKGAADFSSVSFRASLPAGKKHKAVRFWAKLEDVNEIAYEVRPEDQAWWFGLAKQLSAGAPVTIRAVPGQLTKSALGAESLSVVPFQAATVADIPADTEVLVARDGQRVVLFRRPERGWFAWSRDRVEGEAFAGGGSTWSFLLRDIVGRAPR